MFSTFLKDEDYTQLEKVFTDTLKLLSAEYEEKDIWDGYQYVVSFNNGYGISIVKHQNSYGHEDDLWEIAVLKGKELCYDTPITDDVIGWLSSAEVMNYAMKGEMLPPVE